MWGEYSMRQADPGQGSKGFAGSWPQEKAQPLLSIKCSLLQEAHGYSLGTWPNPSLFPT